MNEKYILTCLHVLAIAGCNKVGDSVPFKYDGHDTIHSARVLAVNITHDFALLESSIVSEYFYSLVIHDGSRVTAFSTMGFPKGTVGIPVFDIKFNALIDNECKIDLIDTNAVTCGYSGAPLLNEQNKCVGMIAWIPNSEDSRQIFKAFAVPANIIIKELSSYFSRLAPKISKDEDFDLLTNQNSGHKDYTESTTNRLDMNDLVQNDDKWIKILHLSDPHFGIGEDDGTSGNLMSEMDRNIIFEPLFASLRTLSIKEKIDYVVVSGDIAYKAKEDEYKLFSEWIEKILETLKLEKSNLILCPGNHDFDHEKAKKETIPPLFGTNEVSEIRCCKECSTKSCLLLQYQNTRDDVLKPSKISERVTPFDEYQNMCKKLSLEPLAKNTLSLSKENDDHAAYLYGIREFNDVIFAVFNSEWSASCKIINTMPEAHSIGLNLVMQVRNLVEDLTGDKVSYLMPKFPRAKQDTKRVDDKVVIAVFHRPISCLDPNEFAQFSEVDSFANRNVRTLLGNFVGLILNGHVHDPKEEDEKDISTSEKDPDGKSFSIPSVNGYTLHDYRVEKNSFNIVSVNTRFWCYRKQRYRYHHGFNRWVEYSISNSDKAEVSELIYFKFGKRADELLKNNVSASQELEGVERRIVTAILRSFEIGHNYLEKQKKIEFTKNKPIGEKESALSKKLEHLRPLSPATQMQTPSSTKIHS